MRSKDQSLPVASPWLRNWRYLANEVSVATQNEVGAVAPVG